MVAILMMSVKKGYDVIIYVHDVTNQISSPDSYCRCGHVTKVW